jgi:DNA-binding transcriptional MerR regulator
VVGARDSGEELAAMTLEELAEACGLAVADVTELERYGLLSGRRMAGTTYYDADCIEIAKVAAAFRDFGVEARHLRMYRTAVEREAGFFEQVVTPMLKQRNPNARRQAVETLRELSRLGQSLRAAALRQALRDYLGT